MSEFQSNIHKPQKFNAYFKVHEAYLEQFRKEGLVLKDTLHTYPVKGTPFWLMEGEIWLRGNLRMTVERTLRAFRGPDGMYVFTTKYSYNLTKQGTGNVFRYCSPHETHNQFHHKHIFDPPGKEIDLKVITGEWPTLGDAIREAEKHISD